MLVCHEWRLAKARGISGVSGRVSALATALFRSASRTVNFLLSSSAKISEGLGLGVAAMRRPLAQASSGQS